MDDTEEGSCGTVHFDGHAKANIIKWKIKKGMPVAKGTLLAIYKLEGSSAMSRIKSNDVGTVSEILVSEGQLVNPGAEILRLVGCAHPTVMKDMCAECGADLRDLDTSPSQESSSAASVAMVHSIPELVVSEQTALSLGREDEERLLYHRKLTLLVDLDQTLIHTTNDQIPANLKDVYHFQMLHGRHGQLWYHTRVRPGTAEFLQRMNELFELHILSFGVRLYAHTIAGFIDPEQKYFSHRILSRDECFDPLSKNANLKALFPCGDSMVCIIDDRHDVWQSIPNLVHVRPYIFFEGTADINAPPGSKVTQDPACTSPPGSKVTRDPACTSTTTRVQDDQQQNVSDTGKDTLVKNGLSNEGNMSQLPMDVTMDVAMDELSANEDVCGDMDVSIETNQVDVNKQVTTSRPVAVVKPLSCENEVVAPNVVGPSDDVNEVAMEGQVCSEGQKVGVDVHHLPEVAPEKESEDNIGNEVNLLHAGVAKCSPGNIMLEWPDTDEYLPYLGDILTRIHTAFYEVYDQHKAKSCTTKPDLKNIVPYVRKKVLRGVSIVFSGVFPLNSAPEKHALYRMALELGASMSGDVAESGDGAPVTHVIAARAGTAKVYAARKLSGVHVVQPAWLWSCAERWERVSERLFPLGDDATDRPSRDSPFSSERSRKRKNKASATGKDKRQKKHDIVNININAEKAETDPEETTSELEGETCNATPEKAFCDTFSPLATFSMDELACMDKEVEEIFVESDSSESGEDAKLRKKVLDQSPESSSDESLTGEMPKGWKRKQRKETGEGDLGEEIGIEVCGLGKLVRDSYEGNSSTFQHSSSDGSSSENSNDSDDEMIAALEKEFLA